MEGVQRQNELLDCELNVTNEQVWAEAANENTYMI